MFVRGRACSISCVHPLGAHDAHNAVNSHKKLCVNALQQKNTLYMPRAMLVEAACVASVASYREHDKCVLCAYERQNYIQQDSLMSKMIHCQSIVSNADPCVGEVPAGVLVDRATYNETVSSAT